MIFFVKSEELLKTGFKSALIPSKVPETKLFDDVVDFPLQC